MRCARTRSQRTADAKYLDLCADIDALPLAEVRQWTTRRIVDGPPRATAIVNLAARQIEMERDEMRRLMGRDDSPLNESEAEAFRADVARGRNLAALCGEHRATIRDVERMRRIADRLPYFRLSLCHSYTEV